MIKNIMILCLIGIIAWLVWLIETDDSRYAPNKQSVKEKVHEAVKETGEKTLQGLKVTGEIINESRKRVLEETPQPTPQENHLQN